ncbi:MarR family winged helix-turn-helix transcriptional regulator [Chitinophaga ginsengisoli]|uniref:DNA-binding MarR family transcriptional regulator n=1 Tax=Chitinophaga ginsengisoli TaxID=363837 RepID=A0A2P8GDZ0_9BACT|nr:MarR family transcriptional regulator [Chitinophaga ginsengisoli]PSL32182.1 DNA-binding MarR family transcriptional regulator [Chitinophaga ginsengisoli]
MKDTKIAVQEIRAFNRFYTDIIGLLDAHLLNSAYSLSEVRTMYEIYTGKSVQASQIMTAMHIDKSYLSRILKKLTQEGLISKTPSEEDARASLISLTEEGLKVFKTLNKASDEQIDGLISSLSPRKLEQLVNHMQAIQEILQHK